MPAVAKKTRPAKGKTTPVKKQPLVLVNRPAKFSPKNPPLGAPERHEKGILFVKHLPHGFFEKQLRAFFSQFGDVTRVHVARSKRTLRSKGYAYVEFRYREVAQIAQETMDNYLMFGKILKTVMLPANARRIPRQYEKAFDKDGKETTTYKLWLRRAVARQNGRVTKTKAVERNNRALAKLKKAKEQFKTIGVEYDVDDVTPDYDADQLRKPEHDPEEEAIKARRTKRKAKGKKDESVDESLLEKLRPEAANSDAEEQEEDTSDDEDDLEASFLPLEPEDWDEPASGESETEEVSAGGDKKSALQFAAKAKARLDKEKSKAKRRAPEADSPVNKKKVRQVESSPEVVSSKKKKENVKKVAGGVTKKTPAAAAAVGKKKGKVVKEASKPVKAAAKALLEDASVKKVKGKDIKKKKNKK
uniref:Putative ribosomal bioproteinsis protein gar2 n=1 Tax=Culex tarsalis TaxID=7177 RepID=A0A1Q3F5V9_CULTA